jgi:hypothetical protein
MKVRLISFYIGNLNPGGIFIAPVNLDISSCVLPSTSFFAFQNHFMGLSLKNRMQLKKLKLI